MYACMHVCLSDACLCMYMFVCSLDLYICLSVYPHTSPSVLMYQDVTFRVAYRDDSNIDRFSTLVRGWRTVGLNI